MSAASGEPLNAGSSGGARRPAGAHDVVRLLGPVDVVAQGAVAPLRSAHTRTLLAVLAVRAEQVVTTAMLIDAIWVTTRRAPLPTPCTCTRRRCAACCRTAPR